MSICDSSLIDFSLKRDEYSRKIIDFSESRDRLGSKSVTGKMQGYFRDTGRIVVLVSENMVEYVPVNKLLIEELVYLEIKPGDFVVLGLYQGLWRIDIEFYGLVKRFKKK